MQVLGNQEAFVEGSGVISQAISAFDAGTLTVSFYAAAATGPGVTLVADPVEVTLDGTPLTFGSPSATTITPGSTSMVLYTTDAIAVTSGSHTLAFEGLAPAGAQYGGAYYVAGLDNVSITNTPNTPPPSIPEPSTLALLVAGAIALPAYAWRKRK